MGLLDSVLGRSRVSGGGMSPITMALMGLLGYRTFQGKGRLADMLHPRRTPPMAHYRIYVTTPDGHVTAPPTVFECDDDQEAIGKAAQFVDGQAIELWEGARFIIRFPRNPSS
jgi:hypothetical protein